MRLTIYSILLALSIEVSHAATVAQNFDTLNIGESAMATDWSYIKVSSDPANSYTTVSGRTGNAAQITGNNDVTALHPAGSYIVNGGSVAFDVKSTITGSFSYYINTAARASGGIFMLGNVATGITKTDAGQYIGMQMMTDSFGNRGGIIDGAGSTLASSTGNQVGLDWYTIGFTWTPTSGRTGNFAVTGTGTSKSWTASHNGYTFDSDEAYLGLGAGDYYTTSMTVKFDDVSITGTVIPEPTSVLLTCVGSLALLFRRKR